MTTWKLRTITDETLAELVATSTSFRQVGLKLQMTGGSTQTALKQRVRRLGLDTSHFTGIAWSKGLNAMNHPSIAVVAHKNIVSQTGRPGRPHTKETRQKMSLSASERSFANNARVKWHEVFNPLTNSIVKVQGTWEKRYAEWLNTQGTKWERPHVTFKWRRNDDDIEHTYHPDFYLPETDTYVDIKGYMWKDASKNVDDELKLKLVREQNPTVKLEVLMKYDLKKMGVL